MILSILTICKLQVVKLYFLTCIYKLLGRNYFFLNFSPRWNRCINIGNYTNYCESIL